MALREEIEKLVPRTGDSGLRDEVVQSLIEFVEHSEVFSVKETRSVSRKYPRLLSEIERSVGPGPKANGVYNRVVDWRSWLLPVITRSELEEKFHQKEYNTAIYGDLDLVGPGEYAEVESNDSSSGTAIGGWNT